MTFIGVAIRVDRIASVTQYVSKMGAAFDYSVAADQDLGVTTGKNAKAWMDAAGMGAPRFVPASFVVDRDGRIAWIGSTFDLPQVLEKVIAPDWDVKTFAKIFKNQQDRMNKEYVLRHDPILQTLAAARASIEAKQYLLAIKQLEALPTKGPKAKTVARYSIPMKLFAFRQLGDMKGYYAESRKASELWSDDPHILNLLAWDILDPASRLPVKNYDLAQKLAARAVTLSSRQNANLLDTLAWAYWYRGQRSMAVATEQSALAIAKANDKPEMMAALRTFSGS